VRLAIIPIGGGEPLKVFEPTPNAIAGWDGKIQWTPDGNSVAYLDQRDGVGNIWLQPLDGTSPKQLTDFKDSQIFSFDWLADGRLITSRGTKTGDAVLIKDSQ
jgi:Tol biopolymer transport system component